MLGLKRMHPLSWFGIVIAGPLVLVAGLAIASLHILLPSETEAASGSYEETFGGTWPDGTIVHLNCQDGVLVATTAISSHVLDTVGGDVALGTDPGCRTRAPADYHGRIEQKDGTTVYLFCKGSTGIAVTGVFRNQFGVGGASIALSDDSPFCR